MGFVAACPTTGGETEGRPTPAPTPASSADEPIVAWVVASVTGPTSATDASYLEGMRLAERRVNAAGGLGGRRLALEALDDAGDPERTKELMAAAAASGSIATLLVGPGWVLDQLRGELEAAAKPVVLLGGDLYTPRALFRQAFQASVPLRWQAAVLARYLVVDRGFDGIVGAVEEGPVAAVASGAIKAALAEERSAARAMVTVAPGGPLGAVREAASAADAVLFLGSADGTRRIASVLATLPDPPQLAASSEALSPEVAAPAPGTVAPYPYTWAGWAEPIPRVSRFRRAFEEAFGRAPRGFEQEGYDAVRLVVEGLRRSDGRTGDPLVRALESFRERAFSSLPIGLGPDDRTLIDDGRLGLFAVAAADEEAEPWLTGESRWRPLMRTFTFDGEKTNVLDRDKRVFFPRWRDPRPSPKYWRAIYGITTRPRDDPLH